MLDKSTRRISALRRLPLRRRTPIGEEAPAEVSRTVAAEERIAVATQRQLIWWRFKRHKLALISAWVIIALYAVVVFADFLATADPQASNADYTLLPPQHVHVLSGWTPQLHLHPVVGNRDPVTLQLRYHVDESKDIGLHFFVHGYKYKLFGFIPTDIHLFGVSGAANANSLHILGTDGEGRDVYSRLLLATRTSLTIGLVGVTLSLAIGMLLGGISGYYGGFIDTIIQRLIEVIRSVPTIPLWLGLAAAMPQSWSVTKVYFFITLIISLIGWTELARVVRGRFFQIRNEDFVTAAELAGARPRRVISRHMLPLFTSHIIASTTLALPGMIIAETSLSFLRLGLRPPAVSWGVMLQDAQNIQAIALTPWLLLPVVPVVVAILAFNFVGDGLRDAADPYGS
jgi:peptide/nickel transport system permease protein